MTLDRLFFRLSLVMYRQSATHACNERFALICVSVVSNKSVENSVFYIQGAPWWRLRQATRGRMADGLLEAVRGLHLAHPELGPKPLLAKLRQQQPDLAAGNKEVRDRSAAELREAAAHFERAAALCPAPAMKATNADRAARCRNMAEAS